MVQPIQGMKKVLFFQSMDDATTDGNDLRLAFQTEHTLSMEREEIDELTKDGRLKDTGDISASIELTSYVAENDATYDLLKKSFKDNALLQAWEVDGTDATDGEYPATYVQGKLTTFYASSSPAGLAEVCTRSDVNPTPQVRFVTLTPADLAALESAVTDSGGAAAPAESYAPTRLSALLVFDSPFAKRWDRP